MAVKLARKIARLVSFNARHVRPLGNVALVLARKAAVSAGLNVNRAKHTSFLLKWGGRSYGIEIPHDVCYDVMREIFQGGLYEWKLPLGPKPVIVDIGANVGFASLYFAIRYPDARIICIEPDESNYACLKRNLAAFKGRVKCIKAAAWSRNGVVRLRPAESIDSYVSSNGGEVVKAIRLDGLMGREGIKKIDLLKLDAEGSELQILEGLGSQLAKVKSIIGEIHLWKVEESKFKKWLTSRGFKLALWHRDGNFLSFEAVR